MQKNTQQTIINALLPGQLHTKELIFSVSKSLHISIQSVYTAIRELKKQEIITIHNKYISLSLVWISKQKEKFAFSEYAYKSGKDLMLRLASDRTKITFQFNNYVEADLFWAHAYTILSDKLSHIKVRYFLLPHDFFSYGRNETDSYWTQNFFENTLSTRFIMTHMLSGDTLVLKERRKQLSGVATFLTGLNPLNQSSNVYYNILGDYIFKATFDQKINTAIEHFIANVKKLPLTKDEDKEIQELLSSKGVFLLTIERNKKKAELIEKKLKKYF